MTPKGWSAAGVALAAELSACADEATPITDRPEIAAHREFASPIIRGADGCVDESLRRQEIGYGAYASLTLNVDRLGRGRILDVRGDPATLADVATPLCR